MVKLMKFEKKASKVFKNFGSLLYCFKKSCAFYQNIRIKKTTNDCIYFKNIVTFGKFSKK